MVCDLCNEREATVHLTEIINDQSREVHLCEPCARERGVKMEPSFGLADLLSGLADLDAVITRQGVKASIACPQCGMRLEEIKRSGRLGCGACYEAFHRQLDVLLKRIHGAARHTGKVPAAAATNNLAKFQAELEGLKARLKQAVKAEAFEEAAQVRDRIRALERRARSHGGGRGQRSP